MKSIEEYIASLPDERKIVILKLRETILNHLPTGFEEVISYGMISYVVPHSIYPSGYHCNPKEPVPFISLASQKNYIALYHFGIYADKNLYDWFVNEYKNRMSTKLDMGKSCIRFNNIEKIPYDLIAVLCGKMTVDEWLNIYTTNLNK